jgi:hypothetical protein
VAVLKSTISKILDAGLKLLAAARKVSIIKDDDTRSTEKFDGGNVVSKIPRKMIQTVTRPDTETVAGETGVLEKTAAVVRIRTVIPGRIPSVVAAIVPFVMDPIMNLSRKRGGEKQRAYDD